MAIQKLSQVSGKTVSGVSAGILELRSPIAGTLQKVTVFVRAAVSATLTFDVNKGTVAGNLATIFASPGDRPSITGGNYSDEVSGLSVAVAVGDILSIDADAVGENFELATVIFEIEDGIEYAELSGAIFTGDVAVPDEAYGSGWDGSMEVPTKNAVYDKIETIGGGGISSADVQVFTSSGTWTKPSGAKVVEVRLIGGGGGGGSGAYAVTTLQQAGGSGGGGGGMAKYTFDAAELTSTVAVTVGAGGNGGAARSGASTLAGLAGSNGGITSFATYLKAMGGLGGSAGANSTSVAAATTATTSFIDGVELLTGKAGQGNDGNGSGTNAQTSLYTPTGGGAGSGRTGSGSGGNGKNGGDIGTTTGSNSSGFNNVRAGGTGGASNNSTTAGAGSSATTNTWAGGSGGGGGGAKVLGGSAGGNAAAGGAGGLYGGGGGGGGSYTATSNLGETSGAGGNGANGIAIIITYF